MPHSYRFPLYPELSADNTIISLTFHVERLRCYAYALFWSMIALAIVVTKLFVVDMLAAGPDPNLPIEKQGCGPFNRESIGLGQPFDYDTQNHLSEIFGFPNICTNWDYSPAREITAMFFPFFEYVFAVYLTLDLCNTNLSFQRGELPKWFWTWSKFAYVISLMLTIWFRMIFVIVAYEDPKGHTAGFLGLQVGLVMIALQNFLYIVLTGQSYPSINLSAEKAALIGKTYIVLLLLISSVKIWASAYIVMHGVGPAFYLRTDFILDKVNGWWVDKVWMLLNAVIPFFIALFRSRDETPVQIELTCLKPLYRSEGGETAPIL